MKLNKLGVPNNLWNNIRANKGSGRKPTAEMLKQERKINNKQTGGDNQLMELFNQFASSIQDDNFNSGEDVYNEYIKLAPQEQEQFIQSIQQQSSQQAPQEEMQEETAMMQRGGTNAVRKYQEMLNKKYGTNLKVDGIWGKHTQSVYENSNLKSLKSKDITIGDSKPIESSYEFPRATNTVNLLKGKNINFDRPQDATGYSNINDWAAHFDKQTDSLNSYSNRVKPFKKYATKSMERRAMMTPQEESDWLDSGGVGIRGSAMENRPWTSQNEADFRANKINRSGEKVTPEEVQQAFNNAGAGLTQEKMDYILQERNKERKASDIPSYWKDEDHDEQIRKKYGQPIKKQTGGIPTNKNGYYELDPEENPIARIPSNNITMKNIPYKIKAVGGTTGRDYGYMQPEGEYQFDDEEFMYEIPKAQKGVNLNDITKKRNSESLNSKQYQDYLKNLENEKNSKFLQDSANAIKYGNTKGILNNDYFLTGDNTKTPFQRRIQSENPNSIARRNDRKARMEQSTEIVPGKLPYKTKSGNVVSKKTIAKYSPDQTDQYYANQYDSKKFNKQFTSQELDAQYLQSLESQKELAKIETPVGNKYPDFVAPNNVGQTKNDFRKGKSITMDFDNPAEGQAIAYEKFKNSQSLSPYKQTVKLESPGLYQENEAAYLANVRESRNSALQNMNPNSTIGQSAMSNVYSQSLNQENDAIGQVFKNNAQNSTNYLNQRSAMNNQQQQMNNQYNDKYYNDVSQIEAVKNQNDINYMNQISQMNAKRLQAKNRFLGTAIETGLGDALDIDDNSVTFDVSKIGARINGGSKKESVPNTNKLNVKMIDGVPYHTYIDENGKPQAIPVNVNKAQFGGMGKYRMKLK